MDFWLGHTQTSGRHRTSEAEKGLEQIMTIRPAHYPHGFIPERKFYKHAPFRPPPTWFPPPPPSDMTLNDNNLFKQRVQEDDISAVMNQPRVKKREKKTNKKQSILSAADV